MKEKICLLAISLTLASISFFIQPAHSLAKSSVTITQSIDFGEDVEYEREFFVNKWWVFVFADGELIDIYPEE